MQFLVTKTMSLFYVRSKVCIAPFNVQSKVCIDPIHGRSKVCKFAPHMDGSNVDFSLHMEGIHLLSLQSQPVWDLSGFATKWTRIFTLFIFFLNHTINVFEIEEVLYIMLSPSHFTHICWFDPEQWIIDTSLTPFPRWLWGPAMREMQQLKHKQHMLHIVEWFLVWASTKSCWWQMLHSTQYT